MCLWCNYNRTFLQVFVLEICLCDKPDLYQRHIIKPPALFVFHCSDVHLLQHLQDLLMTHLRSLKLAEPVRDLMLWLPSTADSQAVVLATLLYKPPPGMHVCAVMLSQYGRVHTVTKQMDAHHLMLKYSQPQSKSALEAFHESNRENYFPASWKLSFSLQWSLSSTEENELFIINGNIHDICFVWSHFDTFICFFL